MALHRLASITLGGPDVDQVATYYGEFGLAESEAKSAAAADIQAVDDPAALTWFASIPDREVRREERSSIEMTPR